MASAATSFVDRLSDSMSLSAIEVDVLTRAGVRDHAMLYTLLQTFPCVASLDVDATKLSAMAKSHLAPDIARALTLTPAAGGLRHKPRASGARAPKGANGQPGTAVSWSAAQRRVASPAGAGGAALSVALPSHWPVRNQGDRSTCVAFATVACAEHKAQAATGGVRLSEQFLFWATKMKSSDPAPGTDGSFLRHAHQGLAKAGVCVEALWRYDGTVMAGNVTHHAPPGTPSASASADAQTRRQSGSLVIPVARGAGSAQAVRDELKNGRAVAVSLPMFEDPSGTLPNNWESGLAYSHGVVIDPVPRVVATLVGHAVCITGFHPDPQEANGGYFVFRNSWGAGWAHQLPDPSTPYLGPAPGYGQISATYVEEHLWEMLAL